MKEKIQTLLKELNHGLVEREATLKTGLLTVLAGENVVLIGPPGTGKSMIARRIADSFAHEDNNGSTRNNAYFEYLLTKFSTPEEIFGPLSITELKADRFKRNTAGYLPTVKVAFLDEIFKASSSILNALLTILNERVYHNGSEPQKVPLQALIAASNELPTDQEELSALYDRFLVRGFVDYVSQDNLLRFFTKEETEPVLTRLTAVDLKNIETALKFVTIPPEIAQAVQRIWIEHKEIFKEDRRERLSDRRLKKVIKLMCVSAVTNGRTDVDLSDVFLLKNCLWNHQENALKVSDLTLKTLRTFSRLAPKNEITHEDELSIPTSTGTKLDAVVKGFKGSGTAQDPLLIQTLEDLMSLSHPDVGLKGYNFRQTSDIDCSSLSFWTNIQFKGNYDGSGYTIKNKNLHDLFSIIHEQSNITNLKLENLRLASTAHNSKITYCSSNLSLIQNYATKCIITACESGNSLIYGDATDCTIKRCKSDSFLVNKNSINSTITDCLSSINSSLKFSDNLSILGGITKNLTKGSVIERCFVTGSIKNPDGGEIHFSGIAGECSDSTISQCAVGKFTLIGQNVKWQRRITGQKPISRASGHWAAMIAAQTINTTNTNTSTLKNNASIDSNLGNDDINGKDGKTVAAILFNQRYFKHTLNWDFDRVWQWDNQEDRPTLRSVGVGAASQQAPSAARTANMTDMLTQQISANIWL